MGAVRSREVRPCPPVRRKPDVVRHRHAVAAVWDAVRCFLHLLHAPLPAPNSACAESRANAATCGQRPANANGFGVDARHIHVVPNGVNLRFADATPELFLREYGIHNPVLNVGHIGSLRKNVLGLLKAMERVDAPLVLIGKIHRGEYADRCLQLAKKNPRVQIIEGLPNDSDLLASAYAAAPVFALPSFFETPGIAALEAALAGANVVITPHGGTRDYFGEEGRYVNPNSTESIANGINAALAAPPSTTLRQRIAAEYSWERVGQLTLQAYQKVVAA
ncbi:MAG: glycosyltransferase [Chlorobi bacterium CHB2]|nr:glycosyltransferase [Chlorobi bacterium CHB2]